MVGGEGPGRKDGAEEVHEDEVGFGAPGRREGLESASARPRG